MADPSPALFGMPPERGRWVFVLLGLVMNLAIGSIYAWSVFRKPLEKYFAVGATESLLPFIIFLAFFAFTMPLVGGLLDRYGPRLLSVAGGVIVGAGWLLGSQSTSMTMLAVSTASSAASVSASCTTVRSRSWRAGSRTGGGLRSARPCSGSGSRRS